MKSASNFGRIFAVVVLSYILVYVVCVTIFPKYPMNADLPGYSAITLQEDNPALYSRDPVYADGSVTRTYRASSYLYLSLFHALQDATQHNISATMALLQLIPSVASIFTFYWFLSVFQKDQWLTLMLAVGLSFWLVMRPGDGIPSVYYYACIPIFLRLLWQVLLEPSPHKRPVVLWHVVGIGILISSSALLINSVNGLGFSVQTLGFITVAFLAGRMKWRSYVALLVGLVPILCLVALSGTGGVNGGQNTASAQHMIDSYFVQSVISYSDFLVHLVMVLSGSKTSLVFYLPVSLAVIALSVWLYRFPESPRFIKALYLTLSWLLWSSILGNVGILLYFYLLSRLGTENEQPLDYVFITGINIGMLAGPPLIWVVLTIWQVTQWHTLAFLLSQMFRFQYLTFFLITPTLLFMGHHLTENIAHPGLKRFLQATLIVGIALQTYENFVPTVQFLGLWLAVIILAGLALSPETYFLPSAVQESRLIPRLKVILLGATIWLSVFFFVFWFFLEPNSGTPMTPEALITFSQGTDAKEKIRRSDYLDMAEWLRVNTPVDSLIYLDRWLDSGFFRYLSQRSLLFTWMDELMGPNNADLIARVKHIMEDVTTTPIPLSILLAPRYQMNYIVLEGKSLAPLVAFDQEGWYVPRHVYENESYRIYSVEHLSTEQIIKQVFQIE